MLRLLNLHKDEPEAQIGALYRGLAHDPDPSTMRKAMSALYRTGRYAECLLMVEIYEEAFPAHPFVERTRKMLERRDAFSFRRLAESVRLMRPAEPDSRCAPLKTDLMLVR